MLFLLLTLVSCSNTNNIGRQYGFIEPNTKVNSDIGYLRIFTFSYEEKGDYQNDGEEEVYKGYTVYTLTGDYCMDVEKSNKKPELVKLPAGEYIVIAELHKNIIHSFSINIERGKILEIDKSMIENPYASK
jgi:hypothetical protein